MKRIPGFSYWIGKKVRVTFVTDTVSLDAPLHWNEESGILLDVPEGPTFIPWTAIERLVLLEESN